MIEKNNIFWKEPDNDKIFLIENPILRKGSPKIRHEEGFIFNSFSKNDNNYFFEGRIISIERLENLNFKHSNFKNATNIENTNFIALVEKAIIAIKAGKFQKVVLAQSIMRALPEAFSIDLYFQILCNAYPNALVYCLRIKDEVWIGATPEVFLKRKNNKYMTYALAGTRFLTSNKPFSEKERDEQTIVKNYILDLLKNYQCSSISVSETEEFNTGNLIHLVNEIKFETLNSESIIERLHPTPAVCGFPLQASLDFITKYENLDRAFYSGYLGPVYRGNEFSLWVNLRCAKIANNTIRFYAGAGITEDSIAKSECLETERKMDTLRQFI